MKQNTFIIGGEPKFAEKFIERLNKRLGSDLQLSIHSHKAWNQCGDRKESIPVGTDLVLVLKTNVNHSLRNWARKKAIESNVKFIETAHKTAVAEMEIRHCYQITSNINPNIEFEEMDLYETWTQWIGERTFVLPLWGMSDEGIFTNSDSYERMPWVRVGKKKMIAKWDKQWIHYAKSSSESVKRTINLVSAQEGRKSVLQPLYVINNGKSPYYKLIEIFKSFKEDSMGHSQVKAWADQWLRDAYLGTNFRDFSTKSNINYALNVIFGTSLDDLTEEIKEIIEDHFPKPGRPKKIDTQEPVIEPIVELEPVIEEPVIEEPIVELEPIVEEPVIQIEDYVMLGDLKIIPNNTIITLKEVNLNSSQIDVCGSINVNIQRIENNTLFGVEIKKKG